MPSGFDPMPASRHNIRIVHLQRVHRGTANRRQANDIRSVLTPAKMVIPGLCAGIKQPHLSTGFRVKAVRMRPFIAVAPGARQAEIAGICAAATGEGNDMLDVHLGATEVLGRLAIFTAVLRPRRDLLTASA